MPSEGREKALAVSQGLIPQKDGRGAPIPLFRGREKEECPHGRGGTTLPETTKGG